MFGSSMGFSGTADFNGAIFANDMHGQFTLPSEITSHHISLLMRQTLELDFVWNGT